VEQIGRPEEIYHQPSSVFVAGFIGSANLFRTHLVQRDGTRSGVSVGGVPISVPAGTHDAIPVGAPATVMVRPERVRVLMDAPSNGHVGLPCTVRDLVFQGPVVRVALATANGDEIVAHVGAEEQLPLLRPGDRVWAGWEHDAARLLPEPDEPLPDATEEPAPN
jgi:spermidine/putrescine transport system ATP-binding protein